MPAFVGETLTANRRGFGGAVTVGRRTAPSSGREQPFSERHLGDRFDPTLTECYPRADVATILLAGVDLFIRGKLEASLPGHHLVTSDSVDPPDLVIADVARVDPYDVADEYPDVPLLGFTNHKDTAGLRRANEAGFDQVVAKSALDERAQQLIDELLASLD